MSNINITELYSALMPKVYRFVSLKLNSREDVEDVVSEAFLRFVKTSREFESVEAARPWLFGIVHNVLKEKYREIYKFAAVEYVEEGIKDDSNVEKVELDKETVKQVEKLLRELGEPYLSVISLKLWEEMKFNEVAEILDISLSDAKMTYYRGLEKLKQMMNQSENTKLRSVAILPILVSAMEALKHEANYLPNQAFSQNLINSLGTKSMNLSTLMASKKFLIGAGIVTATAIVGVTLAVAIILNNQSGSNQNPDRTDTPITTSSASTTTSSSSTTTSATVSTQPVDTDKKITMVMGDAMSSYELTVDMSVPQEAVSKPLTTSYPLLFAEYEITGNGFKMVITRPYEGLERKFTNFVNIGSSQTFGTIYRVKTGDELGANWSSYSNSEYIAKQQDCVSPRTPDLKHPCGFDTLNVDPQGKYIGVHCEATNGDYTICDKAVKSIVMTARPNPNLR